MDKKILLLYITLLLTFMSLINVGICQEDKYPLNVSAMFGDGNPLPELEDKIINAINELGYPIESDAFITVDAMLTVVDQKTVSGLSSKSMVNLNLNIKVTDSELGSVFESFSTSGQGLGDNTEDAIAKGIEKIKIDKDKLTTALENCQDDYIKIKERRINLSKERFEEGERLYRAERYREAIASLKGVYPETEQYSQAQSLIRDIKTLMPKVAIAVIKFKSNSDDVATKLMNKLTTELVQMESDEIIVIEREQMSQILNEQNLSLEGIIDPSTASEFGMLIGADFLFIGSLNVSGNSVDVNAKLVRVSTAEIVIADSRTYPTMQTDTFARDLVVQFQRALDSGKLDEKTEIMSPLEEEMKKIITEKKQRVMIMIPETHIHKAIPDPAGETEMIRKFIRLGFKVVDQSQVSKIRDTREAKAAAKGDNQSAVAIARQYGAQIIVIGEAFSENIPRTPSARQTCSARVEARAIYTDTGEILATNGKEAHAMDATELVAAKKALRRSASLLADDMIKQIVGGWKSQGESRDIELFIKGIEYNQLTKLESFIKNLPNVSDVQRRSFDEGVAVIDIQLKDSAQKIADALAGSSFGIKIETMSGNTIEVSTKEP